MATDAPDLTPDQRAEVVYGFAVGYLQQVLPVIESTDERSKLLADVDRLATRWTNAADTGARESVAVAAAQRAVAAYEGIPGAPPLPAMFHAEAQREYTTSPVGDTVRKDLRAVGAAASGAYGWFVKGANAAADAAVEGVKKPIVRGLWWIAVGGGLLWIGSKLLRDDDRGERRG